MADNNTSTEPVGKILVLSNGWVLWGRNYTHSHLVLERAVCIRIWGTDRGLGQLVNGPTSKTILDPLGDVIITPMNVLFQIPTNWAP